MIVSDTNKQLHTKRPLAIFLSLTLKGNYPKVSIY